MKYLGRSLFLISALVVLYACGGGGDGATFVPPATTLTGSVTDTNLEPIEGATVKIIGTNASRKTDAVGRYTFKGLAAGVTRTIKVTGPDASYFPTIANATLINNNPTVLDVYLARAGNIAPPTIDATTGGTAQSDAFIDGPEFTVLNLSANELEDAAGTAYTGPAPATVYLAPIDVGKLGFGLATYQSTLGNVFAALTASSSIIELYGAAAVSITDDAGNPLQLIDGATTTLDIPIPATPSSLRTFSPVQGTLWYLDETTGKLVEQPTLNADKINNTYNANINRTGVWLAGIKHDFSTLTEITGRLVYSNGKPAAGATVYVNGTDYAYQNQTTANGNGQFAFAAKTGGNVVVHAVIAANGAQWPYETTIDALDQFNAELGDISLPYSKPVAGAAAEATVIVDSRDIIGGGQGPNVLGYILSAGRQISDPADPDNTALNVGDFAFIANQFDAGTGIINLTPTQSNAGIQIVAGQTFETMTTAPTTGYIPDPGVATAYAINLETETLPLLLAVRTTHGHYGKISIESVTDVSTLGDKTIWQITFRHAFSLTGNF